MIKNRTIIPAICLALMAAITGCRQSNGNTQVTNTTIRNGSAAEITSGTNPLPASRATPLPDASSKTVQARLTHVETNADLIDSPIADSKIVIKAGASSFNATTNKDGVALFDGVACGDEVVISLHDEVSGEDAEFRRKLECGKAPVDLGVITTPFGGKPILEQRKAEFIQYDPVKEVWLSDGRIIPGETIERILSKYQ
jgi:hypothetical protein